MPRIEYDLAEADFMAYAKHHFRHSDDAKASQRRMLIIGLAAFGIYAYGIKDDAHYGLQFPALYALRLVLTLAVFGFFIGMYVRVARPLLVNGMLRNRARHVAGKASIELKDDGAHVSTNDGKGRLTWELCRGVVDDKEHIYLLMGPLRALIVPKRAFSSADTAADFTATAREYFRNAHPGKIEKA